MFTSLDFQFNISQLLKNLYAYMYIVKTYTMTLTNLYKRTIMSNTKKVTRTISAQFDAWSYGPKITPAERKASKLYVVSQANDIKDFEDIDRERQEAIRLSDEAFKLECIRTRIQELETELKELRSQLPIEPKVSTYKKPMNLGVGSFIISLIETGLGNTEILKKVEEHYGNKNTTYACVAWYRNKVNNS